MTIRFQRQEALGISTGDLLRIDDGIRTYRVARITQPTYTSRGPLWLAIWPYPVISIVGAPGDWNMIEPLRSAAGHFNEIHQEGNRWFEPNHEIYIEKMDDQPMVQMDIFTPTSVEPTPYVFQDGVDYELNGQLWHCYECGQDFNAHRETGCNPLCCNRVSYAIYMMGKAGDTRCTYQRYLGYPEK